jgi:predicted RNA binding protein YcfA (HicA-like mRNA interferase family)
LNGRLPSISARDAVRAFQRIGFRTIPGRGNGSHIAMARDDSPGVILIIPAHGDVPRGTPRALIRAAGVTIEQFVKVL